VSGVQRGANELSSLSLSHQRKDKNKGGLSLHSTRKYDTDMYRLKEMKSHHAARGDRTIQNLTNGGEQELEGGGLSLGLEDPTNGNKKDGERIDRPEKALTIKICGTGGSRDEDS